MARASEREDRGFKYKKRDKDVVRQRANSKGGGYDSIVHSKYKMYKARDGKNIIRILPPTWDDAGHYALSIFVNYSIGVDNQSYLSLAKHGKGKDPIAEARKQAERDGDEKLTKALKPRERALMWVIDRLDEDEGPQLWAAPYTVDKDICSICYDEDTKDVVWIDEPKTGQDIRFYKEGTGLTTEYPAAKMKLMGQSPLHDDETVMEEWLDYVNENPLPDCLNFYDYDHIKAVFNGAGPSEDDDDDDEDVKPRKRASKSDDDDEDEKPRKRASRDDDDEEEAPKSRKRMARDDDEDEAEEEKPKSRKRDADDDDDDEEEAPKTRRRASRDDDDDEDEEEKPKSSKRASRDDDEEEDRGSRIRSRIRGKSKDDDDED